MAEKLPLTDCNETHIYLGLCHKLRNDPTLKRVIKQWQLFDGKMEASSTNRLPCLSFAPKGEADTEVASYDQSLANLYLEIAIFVDGTNAADIFNLWNAVNNVLNPGDESMNNFLSGFGANRLFPVRPAYGSELQGEVLTQYASGTVRIQLFVKSGG
jgi:hypothetical protein